MYINSSNNRAASTIYVYPRESKRINGLARSLRLLYFLRIKELKKSTIVCVVGSKLSFNHCNIINKFNKASKQTDRTVVLTRLVLLIA